MQRCIIIRLKLLKIILITLAVMPTFIPSLEYMLIALMVVILFR